MIEIEITKDIRKYESKLVGPFTTRQTICAAIACVIAYIVFRALEFLAIDIRLFVITIFISPLLFLGWIKPYGMKFEQFISTAFASTFIAPRIRKYKTINAFSIQNIETNTKAKKKKKTKKSKPSSDKELRPFK